MPNYNTDTKTKFILSDRKGAPLLPPVWGSLNALLKVVLVEGFNPQTITSIAVDPHTKLATAKLTLGHGYIRNDVISISGATQVDFNKEFRVVDFKADEINFVMPPETLVTEATTTTSIICKIAPLGYSLAYENPTEGVMCFKNTSVQSPAILKVIDKVPPNGYTTTWAKFARVVAGQEIDSVGDFVGNRKTPYNPDFPDMEKTGNKVRGLAGIHGLAKWYYGVEKYENDYEFPEGVPVTWKLPTDWKIIGDDKTFYLMIKSQGKVDKFCIYSFGNFISEVTKDTSNIVLNYTHMPLPANVSYTENSSNYARTRNYCFIFEQYLGNSILSSVYGGIPYISFQGHSSYTCTGMFFSSNLKPWDSNSITSIHPITGDLISSEVGIKDSDNIYRGRHRGIRIVYGKSGLSEGIETDSFDIVTMIQDPEFQYSQVLKDMPIIFSLKDWEDVP